MCSGLDVGGHPLQRNPVAPATAPLSHSAHVKLPNAERAFLDIAKLRDYSLSPQHKEGRHKARVFASALGLDASDAEWLGERPKRAIERVCKTHR
jgi:hypothetical protein